MVGFLARGPLKDWDIPDAGLSKLLGRTLGFLGAAFVIGGWFLATPETIMWMLIAAITFLVVATIFTVIYALNIFRYKFVKEIANPDGRSVTKVPLLGGDALTPLAKTEQDKCGDSEQRLLEKAAFDPDKVWPRESRIRVMARLSIYFILALTLGAGGISWLGYSVQVRLTNKPAAEVLRQKDAPGIENMNLPDKGGAN
jgi:hypothetical protein